MKNFIFVFLGLVFHVFQIAISMQGNLYISAFISAITYGIFSNNLYSEKKRILNLSPIIVSIIGTLIWFIAVFFEY